MSGKFSGLHAACKDADPFSFEKRFPFGCESEIGDNSVNIFIITNDKKGEIGRASGRERVWIKV